MSYHDAKTTCGPNDILLFWRRGDAAFEIRDAASRARCILPLHRHSMIATSDCTRYFFPASLLHKYTELLVAAGHRVVIAEPQELQSKLFGGKPSGPFRTTAGKAGGVVAGRPWQKRMFQLD